MTTRTMYDAVNLNAVPKAARMVAYYLNGLYVVESVAWVRSKFPNAILVPIDVIGDRADYALVGDVETGDMRPEHTEQWITDWRMTNPAHKVGGTPTLYCDRSTIPAVRTGTGPYLLGRDYHLWIATGDGTIYTGQGLSGPFAKDGVVACQDIWKRLYDSSLVFDASWPKGAQ